MTPWNRCLFVSSIFLSILIFSDTANSQVNELKPLLEISVGNPREERNPFQAVKFTSPSQGTAVGPGQTVHFTLYIDPKLQPALVGVSPAGRSDIEDINIGRPPWEGSFVVPESNSGQIKLRPFVITIDGGIGLGRPLTLPINPGNATSPSSTDSAEPMAEIEELSYAPFPRESSEGVQVVAPPSGNTVKPGESITISLKVDSSVGAEALQVRQERPNWTGGTETETFPGPPFETTVTIPEEFSGLVNLRCTLINRTYGSVGGANIPVSVIPDESPVRLWVWPKVMVLDPPRPDGSLTPRSATQFIQVSGRYANNVRRRLEPPVMETTYRSTDKSVVIVDERGKVQPVASGMAQIIVRNRDVEETVEVIVEETTDPDERTRLKIMVKTGEYRHNENTGKTTQKVTVINGSRRVRTSNVYLLVSKLPDGVTLSNRDGVSQKISPGTPYKDLTPEDGDFRPGDTTESILQFDNPDARDIEYRPRLIWGTRP